MGAISSHLLLFFKLMYLPKQLPELSLNWASSPSEESRAISCELSNCADSTMESSNSELLEKKETSVRECHTFSTNIFVCIAILRATPNIYIPHYISSLPVMVSNTTLGPTQLFSFYIFPGFLSGLVRIVLFSETEDMSTTVEH